MLEKNIQKSLPIVNTTSILLKGISEIPKKIASLPVKLIKAIPKASGKLLMVDEPTIKNYFKLGKLYILKKLVLFVALLLALVIISAPFIIDFLQNHDFTKVIVYGSPLHKSYDGKAKLVSFDPGKYTLYIGEFKNGKYQGDGTEYYASGEVKYTGGFKNGKYEGSGIFYSENKADESYYKLYEGEFKNNSFDGNGIEYFDSGKIKYEGEFKSNKYEGKGVDYFDSGNIKYEGEFKNNKYEGKGTEYFDDTSNIKYEGEFKDSKYNGNGKLFYSDGRIQYEGSFCCGNFDGIGVKYSSEGYKEYEGGYKKGNFSGEGTEYTIDGNVLYKGCFSDNKYNGIGTLYNEKLGDIYKGYFKDGNPFYQGFLGLSESKLKEIVGEPDKPSDDISGASSGEITDDNPIGSMSTSTPTPPSTPAPASTPSTPPSTSPTTTPTEKGITFSYEKYAMEFILEPLSSTQKIPVVQVVRISGESTVSGISCGMNYKTFKNLPMIQEMDAPVSYKLDNFTIVGFTENEYIYTLYFNNTTDSLEYIEIETENLVESS